MRYRNPRFLLLASIGGLLFIGELAFLLNKGLAVTNGTFVYAVDDAYIHMAIAKNVANYGAWSINAQGFSSATSSVLWPLFHSVFYMIFGVSYYLPLIVNVVCAIVSLLFVAYVFERETINPLLAVPAVITIVLAVPMVGVALEGMEHQAHLLLTLVVAYLGVNHLVDENTVQFSVLVLLAFFLGGIRYESVFLIGPLGALFLAQKEVRRGIALWIAGAAPIVAYGIFSIINGAYFLPNSLKVKATGSSLLSIPGLASMMGRIVENLQDAQILSTLPVLALVLLGGLLLVKRTHWRKDVLLLALFVTATAAHLALAKTGYFFRYEAYLVAFGILAVVVAINNLDIIEVAFSIGDQIRANPEMVLLLIILLAAAKPTANMLVTRGENAHEWTPDAQENIYSQQYQMAQFIDGGIENSTIIMSDIGTASYYTDARILDLVGLATRGIVDARLSGEYDMEFLKAYAEKEDVDFVIIHPKEIPDSWTVVGTWTASQRRFTIADRTVMFVAVHEDAAEELAAELCEYSSKLPPTVEEDGSYTQRCPAMIEEGGASSS